MGGVDGPIEEPASQTSESESAVPDVFVSYSRKDAAVVTKAVGVLERAGLSVWWDRSLDSGTRYDAEIERALRTARTVIVFWSTAAIDSDWVRSEAHEGFDRGVLLPVMIEPVIPPVPFRRLHASQLVGWPKRQGTAQEMAKLVNRIFQSIDAESQDGRPPGSGRLAGVPTFDGRVAVAVLPFTIQGPGEDDDYLADGITEDLITRFQRFRTFPVISRHSSFAFKGKVPYDLPGIAETLGVGYILMGQIRRAGSRIRITVELLETKEFHGIWSERYDREVEDIFDLQDEITLVISAIVEPEIERAEARKALPSQTESIAVWHLIRKGMWHHNKLTREDALEARRCYDLALEQDPSSAEALIQLGWWYFFATSAARGLGDAWDAMEDCAQRASVIDPQDARAIGLMGVARMMRGDARGARQLYKQAIRLNPSYAWAYSHLGTSYYLSGEPAKGIAHIESSIRLSPYDLFVFHAWGELAQCHYMLGQWGDALRACDSSLALRPGYWLAHIIRIGSLARSGRLEEARDALSRFLQHRSDFGMKDIQWVVFEDKRWNEYLAEGLRQAGWEEE